MPSSVHSEKPSVSSGPLEASSTPVSENIDIGEYKGAAEEPDLGDDNPIEVSDIPNGPSSENKKDGFFHRGIVGRVIDSYRRAPPEAANDLEAELKSAVSRPASKQSFKTRHVVMMSLGSGIGTGLLVNNGKALSNSGPAPLIIGYGCVSFITYFMVQAAGEMAVAFPTIPGSFNAYSTNFVSAPFGFATTWLYFVQWLTMFPMELITMSLVIRFWNTSVDPDIFVLIYFWFVFIVHFLGTEFYAETEFIFNMIKVCLAIGFIIFAICLTAGGVHPPGYIGSRYWHDPGAFVDDTGNGRFKGICYTLVAAYFAYGGTELFVLSVNEQENPRRSTPTATKTTIYRIVIVYLLTMILVGFTVPNNQPRLIGSPHAKKGVPSVSPYVLAAYIHHVHVLPHFFNTAVMLSIVSMSSSSIFAAPRLICCLAQQGYCPKFLDYVDRRGRPIRAMGLCFFVGIIAFCAHSEHREVAFGWLSSVAGLSELYTWGSIMLSHVRFRLALRKQNRTTDGLGYKATTGIWGSLYGVFFTILVFIAEFWVALSPPNSNGKCSADDFFESYLAFPIWLIFYLGYMIFYRDFTFMNPLSEIDLDTHSHYFDPEFLRQEDEERKQALKKSSIWVRLGAFFC